MKVLLLSSQTSPLIGVFKLTGDDVILKHSPLSREQIADISPDWCVSFGYRHIIRSPVLELLHDRIINLHISFLPFNRGAHPNFWSWAEETPAGVTIHHIDEGIDTGDIIAQQRVKLDQHETLASSYEKLQQEMIALFTKQWSNICEGDARRTKQPAGGSVHRMKDIEPYKYLLTEGWNTSVSAIRGIARKNDGQNLVGKAYDD